ncbi:hypothetical protein, partial [Klebsiella pneumoniae]|uniref:hypothetical protein n=1 Tax=Klebsiella pneumoniae TaxID=573 RepID=UPI001D0E9A71
MLADIGRVRLPGNRFRRAGVGVEGRTGMTAINLHALSSLQSGKRARAPRNKGTMTSLIADARHRSSPGVQHGNPTLSR